MMGSFLDALGIAHEEGLIADEELERTAGRAVDRLAVAAIGAAYPAEDVSLYLSTLLWQDPKRGAAWRDLPQV